MGPWITLASYGCEELLKTQVEYMGIIITALVAILSFLAVFIPLRNNDQLEKFKEKTTAEIDRLKGEIKKQQKDLKEEIEKQQDVLKKEIECSNSNIQELAKNNFDVSGELYFCFACHRLSNPTKEGEKLTLLLFNSAFYFSFYSNKNIESLECILNEMDRFVNTGIQCFLRKSDKRIVFPKEILRRVPETSSLYQKYVEVYSKVARWMFEEAGNSSESGERG